MKFIRNLLGGRKRTSAAQEKAQPVESFQDVISSKDVTETVAMAADTGRKKVAVEDAPLKHPPIRVKPRN